MPVLYRTYRSQRFAELVGQKPIIKTLQNAVRSNNVAHAYLFCGGRGVGKTSAARILAKAINCPNQKNGDACGKCQQCLAIAAGTYLDLVEIDAASHTGVDSIRELIGHVSFKPTQGKYKVIIIDEVHMLSKSAFNALLKTLEEPPAHAVFVLATTDPQKLPETIVSRTQKFDFRRISETDIAEALTQINKSAKLGLQKDIIALVAHSANGGMRDALSLLEQASSLGPEATLSEVEQLLGVSAREFSNQLLTLVTEGKTPEIYPFFESLLDRGTDFRVFNRDFLELIREQISDSITKKSATVSTALLVYMARLFLRSYKEAEISPDPSLPMLLASLEAAEKFAKPGNSVQPKEDHRLPVQTDQPELVKEDSGSADGSEHAANYDQPLPAAASFWPAVVDAVRQKHNPLGMLLKEAAVTIIENKIVLSVAYSFHQEQLKNAKNQSFILEAVHNITGLHTRLQIDLHEPESKPKADNNQSIEAGLMILGGEMVD